MTNELGLSAPIALILQPPSLTVRHEGDSDVQRQAAVTAYFSSKQLLLFAFAQRGV